MYQELNNNILLKEKNILPSGNPDPTQKIKTFFDTYDDKNNLTQCHQENGLYTFFIWGYNKSLLVAKIEKSSPPVYASFINAVQTATDTGTETDVLQALNNLRNSLPHALVTTYTHKPLIGISTITDVNGDKKTFTYDTQNRLQSVKDKDGNILSENEYHFKN